MSKVVVSGYWLVVSEPVILSEAKNLPGSLVVLSSADPCTEVDEQPSPLGRGCPAAGALTSRSGTGEGSLPKRGDTRSAYLTILFGSVYPH
jgi:hypothetical protein